MAIFGFTLFLSALLLFLAELMFAKIVLPLLGGTPAVWNTCMVFFQAALLAGYAYAHWLTSRIRIRRQTPIHAALILSPLLLLPIGVPRGWVPPAEGNPVPWLLALMLVTVGPPFVAVSTTAPVLQRWFARTDHAAANDPYFLYAASNVGSLMGLAGYLIMIEPRLTIAEQARAWEYGYVLLALLIGVCAWIMRRSPAATYAAQTGPLPVRSPIPLGRRLRWLGLAFVPSSLMLGFTTYATTDIASVPLLWSIPLAIYLLTFILAFSRRSYLPKGLLVRALPVLVLIQMIMLPAAHLPFAKAIPIHLLTFFVTALLCHRELADDRPPVEHLTVFYLLVAVGGALGGLFNGILAPTVFRSVLEYPLVLVLACVLCLKPSAAVQSTQRASGLHPAYGMYDLLLPAGIAGLATALNYTAVALNLDRSPQLLAGMMGLLVLACYPMAERPIRFGLALAAVLIVGVNPGGLGLPIHQERNFFGVTRVVDDAEGALHLLYSGTTLHGSQWTSSKLCDIPTCYYSPTGPLGQVVRVATARHPRLKVGTIGLGVGSVCAYAKAGQSFTFYEIDPVVERVAENTSYFTYLARARKRGADVRIVLGDGRLTMGKSPDGTFDLVILDAFSSDSIPMHLLTREALQLYLRKLRPGGIIAMNVSSRHLDLEPLVAALAADAGLIALIRHDTRVTRQEIDLGRTPSVWAVFARNKKDLGDLPAHPGWRPAKARPGMRVWTDDYSNILQVLHMG